VVFFSVWHGFFVSLAHACFQFPDISNVFEFFRFLMFVSYTVVYFWKLLKESFHQHKHGKHWKL